MTVIESKLYRETPCIRSTALSAVAGCNIYLKLDNLQPSGSFKSRGIGTFIQHSLRTTPSTLHPLHFYCSSSGNAGIACITATRALSQPATIVVHSQTSPIMLAKLHSLGATVHISGSSWAEADSFLRENLLAEDPSGVYVPPFDHPVIWEAAESATEEIARQVPGLIDGIVCSVGGGGLFNGIVQGMRKEPLMKNTRVLAVETTGADSLAACVRAGSHVSLPKITSIASSLGAVRVSKRTWALYEESGAAAVSAVVTDGEAVEACLRFADDERMLVEPACGATLAAAYTGLLEGVFKQEGREWSQHTVVLEVCGGSGVSLELLQGWRETYGLGKLDE